MILRLQDRLAEAVRAAVREDFGAEVRSVAFQYPPRLELGDLALTTPFDLARTLRRNPREIAQRLADRLGAAPGVRRTEVAGGGYLNLFLDRALLARELLEALRQATAAEPLPGRVIVEHTSINPNKAAHIGHLRNAALGDTFVRVLRHRGRQVGVQNYIDDTGVQVADVVVGFQHLEGKGLADVERLDGRFDYYCWDLYAKVGDFYAADPARRALQAQALHAIEAGDNETARLAAHVATRIVECHLRTMERLDIRYDLLAHESDILRQHFWDEAFERLKSSGAIRLEREGKNAGCWMLSMAGEEPSASAPEGGDSLSPSADAEDAPARGRTSPSAPEGREAASPGPTAAPASTHGRGGSPPASADADDAPARGRTSPSAPEGREAAPPGPTAAPASIHGRGGPPPASADADDAPARGRTSPSAPEGRREASREATAAPASTPGRGDSLPAPADADDAPARGRTSPSAPEGRRIDEDKIIVRSNGTVTYTGKDIAYQLWKLGLLDRDFRYRRQHEYPDGHVLWTTKVEAGDARDDSTSSRADDVPVFGHAREVYNVIDVGQSYPQRVVKAGVAALGARDAAEASHHLAYEKVVLTPATARALGFAVSDDDAAVKVSGRKGLGVKADDLMDGLVGKARTEVLARDPGRDPAAVEETARTVAVGALRYFLLKFSRTKIITFDMEEALAFTGETGPYVQNGVVRARNIFAKLEEAGHGLGALLEQAAGLDLEPLLDGEEGDEVWSLLMLMARTDDVAEQAVRGEEVALVAKHAFAVAQAFHAYYQKPRYSVLYAENAEKRAFRALVVHAFLSQMAVLGGLLGIPVPERM